MADLVVIVPTRGRPNAAAEVAATFAATCTADTRVSFAIDADDPNRHAYLKLAGAEQVHSIIEQPPGGTMVSALNMAAETLLSPDPQFGRTAPYALGFMGDDHRPRTKGWDTAYLEALRDLGTGMVFGDDQIQRERLPTQIAMTADIVRAVGSMAPASLVHLCVDNWWLELGRAAGCIRYLPGVTVEHMHPVAGKAEWDEGHRRVNAPVMYHHDQSTMARLRVTDLPAAVAKVKALRGVQ